MKNDPTITEDGGAPKTFGLAAFRPFDESKRSSWPRPPGYTIKDYIGGGGQSLVFAATDRGGRLVAIKLPRAVFSPQATERLREEFRMLCELPEHPSLARVFYSHVCEGPDLWSNVPFYAMELVHGMSLREFCMTGDGGKPLTYLARLRLFEQICEAVHAANTRIVHCDLKPDNILVEPGGRPKIIDFGIARRIAGEEGVVTFLSTGYEGVGGTLAYMSPEQIIRMIPAEEAAKLVTEQEARELTTIGRASDVYSLGVILHELLAGSKPYPPNARADGPMGYARAKLKEAPTPLTFESSSNDPASRAARADPLLTSIASKALRKCPASRLPSAGRLAEALRRHRYLTSPLTSGRASGNLVIAIGVAIAAMLLAELFAVPLFYRWTNASLWWQRTVVNSLPQIARPEAFSGVRLLAIDDETDLEAIAAVAGIEGVSNKAIYTSRAIWGWLFERIADAGAKPRAVACDLLFRDRPEAEPFDNRLRTGMLRLISEGIPIAVASDVWPQESNDSSNLTHALPEQVMVGGATADTGAGVTLWEADLALRRQGRAYAMPSLSFLAIALAHRPGYLPSIQFNDSTGEITARFEVRAEGRRSTATDDEAPLRIMASTIHSHTTGFEQLGLFPGDRTARLIIQIPSDDVLRRITMTVQQAARASPKELRDSFDHRIIVAGNIRGSALSTDVHPNLDGRMVPGTIAHVVAIDSLQRVRALRNPNPNRDLLLAFLAALSGTAAMALPRRSLAAHLGLFALLTVAWLGASLIGYYAFDLLIDPWVQVFAAATGMVFIIVLRGPFEAVRHLRERADTT